MQPHLFTCINAVDYVTVESIFFFIFLIVKAIYFNEKLFPITEDNIEIAEVVNGHL